MFLICNPSSHKFCYVVFSFSLMYFLNFTFQTFVTHGLFGSVLFHIHVFGDFPVIFLFLPSSLIIVREHTV